MESIDIIKLFWISNIVLWIFLLAVALYMGNRSILTKKGYNNDYIAFMRRDYTTRSVIMAVVIPAIQLAAYFLVKWFTKDVSSNLELVFLVFICMIIPFPIIDNIYTSRKIKKLNMSAEVEIVVDLKHKVLNRIFNPGLELVLLIATAIFALVITKPVFLFYLHLVFPWIFYLAARRSKNTVRPHLRDGYLWAFIFIIINFCLVIYYLVSGLSGMIYRLPVFISSTGILLVAILAGRIIYYLVNYPEFRKRLTEEPCK